MTGVQTCVLPIKSILIPLWLLGMTFFLGGGGGGGEGGAARREESLAKIFTLAWGDC